VRSTLSVIACVIILGRSHTARAQWDNVPRQGTPRTADGKPNLTAPAPRTPDGKPDLSGIWMRIRPPVPEAERGSHGLEDLLPRGFVFPFQPWAEALFRERQSRHGSGRPSERCLPHGIPDAMLPETPFKIVQHSGLTLILHEQHSMFRQVFADGRRLPADPNPAWLGYSVGRWDGDTFVVQSSGFNDRTWLDDSGHPHSDAMRTTERFRRVDFGHMEMELTIDDPKAYTRPWSVIIRFNLMPDTELIENVCENEKDSQRLSDR
jgi:hypothetical protein